jgi:hypothetical protein
LTTSSSLGGLGLQVPKTVRERIVEGMLSGTRWAFVISSALAHPAIDLRAQHVSVSA